MIVSEKVRLTVTVSARVSQSGKPDCETHPVLCSFFIK